MNAGEFPIYEDGKYKRLSAAGSGGWLSSNMHAEDGMGWKLRVLVAMRYYRYECVRFISRKR